MRICLICNEYATTAAGGQGLVIRAMAEGWRSRDHEVRVIGLGLGLSGDEGQLVDIPVGRFRGAWLAARRKLWKQVRAWAKAGEIDLAEVPLSRGMAASSGKLPIPLVVRAHGSHVCRAHYAGRRAGMLHRLLEPWSLARADAVSSVSEFMAAELVERFCSPSTVIYNPVRMPAPAANDWADRGLDLIYAGRDGCGKGLHELLQAWGALSDLPLRLQLYGRVALTDVPAGVTVHGPVSQLELQQAFQRARYAVLPSRFESFGLAAAEAMACGAATIVAAGTGSAELGAHGVHCLHASCDGDAIAEAVRSLVEDTDGATKIATTGAEHVALRFTLDRALDETEAFYQATIAAFRRS